MFYDEGDVYSSWSFITVEDIQKVEPDSVRTWVGTIYERRVNQETKKITYTKVVGGEETKVKKSTIKEEVEKLVPNKIRIKSTTKNTKANITKYFTKVANFKSLATKK